MTGDIFTVLYVPQFYLRAFSISEKSGELYLYRRGSRPRRAGISIVASDEDYYTIKTDMPGVDKRVIDKLFQDVESESAPLLKEAPNGIENRIHGK